MGVGDVHHRREYTLLHLSIDKMLTGFIWNLKVALGYVQYFEEVAEHYVKLSGLCPIFERFADMYPKSTKLQAAVGRFCIITVEFCTNTIIFLQKRGSRICCLIPHAVFALY